MTQTVQLQCIRKSDRAEPWDRITPVGGVNSDGTRWKLTQQEAIAGAESGIWRFWVAGELKRVWVMVAVSRFGNLYLKPEGDRDQPKNLLSLVECPPHGIRGPHSVRLQDP
jgi:hypothetical protein